MFACCVLALAPMSQPWPLARSELAAQVLHRPTERFYVAFVVVEMKTRAEIIVTVGSDDVALHEFPGEPAAVTRRNGHGCTATRVLSGRDTRPADVYELLHAAPGEREVTLLDGRRADVQQKLQ